ncbi:MAG: matrixin family metalloprotease [Pirellulales bacterium]|nr:matrixin family metalloprotease [Pirellulales bacterium]
MLLYNLGAAPWTETNLSFSFAPDGTPWRGQTSLLFAELDRIAPRDVWHREYARALQTWANHSNLNFHLSSDDGTWNGVQGTIRLGSIAHHNGVAFASYPSPSFSAGDITLNANATFAIGGVRDLYATLVHESGHSLGLNHTVVAFAAMQPYVGGALPGGIGPDDIAGIQALYGARRPDSFDAAAANDTFATATVLAPNKPAGATYSADLTSHADVDYYRTTIPAGAKILTVAVDARELSLLAPKVAVYDQSQNLVATAAGKYGTVATVEIPVTPGQTYTLVADGATTDEFGMGAYRLNVQFTRDENQPVLEPTGPPATPATPPPSDTSGDSDPATDPEQDVAPPADAASPGGGDVTPPTAPSGADDSQSGPRSVPPTRTDASDMGNNLPDSTPPTANQPQQNQTPPAEDTLTIRVTRRRNLASAGAPAAPIAAPASTQADAPDAQQSLIQPTVSEPSVVTTPPASLVPPVAEIAEPAPAEPSSGLPDSRDVTDPTGPEPEAPATDPTEPAPEILAADPPRVDDEVAAPELVQTITEPIPSQADSPASVPPVAAAPTPTLVIRVTRRVPPVSPPANQPPSNPPPTTPQGTPDDAAPSDPTAPGEPTTDPADPNTGGGSPDAGELPAENPTTNTPPSEPPAASPPQSVSLRTLLGLANVPAGDDGSTPANPPGDPAPAGQPSQPTPNQTAVQAVFRALTASVNRSTPTYQETQPRRLLPSAVDLVMQEASQGGVPRDPAVPLAPAGVLGYHGRQSLRW